MMDYPSPNYGGISKSALDNRGKKLLLHLYHLQNVHLWSQHRVTFVLRLLGPWTVDMLLTIAAAGSALRASRSCVFLMQSLALDSGKRLPFALRKDVGTKV